MRIAYMGTPHFAVPTLEALVRSGHEVAAVYTQPPRAAHRGKTLSPTPVHARAQALGLDVRTPVNFKDPADRQAFAALDLDLAVVAAYGLILPEAILQAPRHGCINVHASLLPRWRGAAPVQRAILAGDAQTGVTIMQMERGLDTGPMLAVAATPIARKTAGELTDELARLGAALIEDVLARLPDIAPIAQSEAGVTYANKIDKAEARLDFAEPAIAVERKVRAFNPAPGAFVELLGERLKILTADVVEAQGPPGTVIDGFTIACGEGAIRPTQVQRAGRPIMSAEAMLRGMPIAPGTRLG